MTSFYQSRLDVGQNCLTDATKTVRRRHIVEQNFAIFIHTPDTRDLLIALGEKQRKSWVGNPVCQMFRGLVGGPPFNEFSVILMIGGT